HVAAYSPRYAAPEQLGRGRTGPWTDVHAMGLIITEMLIGHAAYTSPASDNTALCAEVMNSQRPTPGRFGIDVGAWELVLRKALALRSADRFTNAAEFLEVLEAKLDETTSESTVPKTRASVSVIHAATTGASQSMTGGLPIVPARAAQSSRAPM